MASLVAADWMFWLARVVGVVALFVNLRANLRRSDNAMKRNMAVASLLWSVYHAMLGAFTAASISLVSMSRQVLTSRLDLLGGRAKILVERAYYVVSVLVCAVSWHGWASLLPLFGTMLSTYGMFHLRFERFRWAMIVSGVFWAGSALYFHAWEALFATLVSTATVLVGMRGVKLNRLLHERKERVAGKRVVAGVREAS